MIAFREVAQFVFGLTGGKVVYPRLCRACSVWIYPNAPKRLANHVRQTWMTEKNIVGTAPLSDGEDEANRLMGIWKIYIRDGMPPSKDQKILWLFYVLFTRTILTTACTDDTDSIRDAPRQLIRKSAIRCLKI